MLICLASKQTERKEMQEVKFPFHFLQTTKEPDSALSHVFNFIAACKQECKTLLQQ